MIVSLPYKGDSKRKEFCDKYTNNPYDTTWSTRCDDKVFRLQSNRIYAYEFVYTTEHISNMYLYFDKIEDADMTIYLECCGNKIFGFNTLVKGIVDDSLKYADGRHKWSIDILASMSHGIRIRALACSSVILYLDSPKTTDVHCRLLYKRRGTLFNFLYQDPIYEVREYPHTYNFTYKSLLHTKYMYLYRPDNKEIDSIIFIHESYNNCVKPEKMTTRSHAIDSLLHVLQCTHLPNDIVEHVVAPYLEQPAYLPEELIYRNIYMLIPQYDGTSDIEIRDTLVMEKRMCILIPSGCIFGLCEYNQFNIQNGSMGLVYSP